MNPQLGAFTLHQWSVLVALGVMLVLGIALAVQWVMEFRRARRAGCGFMSSLLGIGKKAALPVVGGVAGEAAAAQVELGGADLGLGLGGDWGGGAGADCGGGGDFGGCV